MLQHTEPQPSSIMWNNVSRAGIIVTADILVKYEKHMGLPHEARDHCHNHILLSVG